MTTPNRDDRIPVGELSSLHGLLFTLSPHSFALCSEQIQRTELSHFL
jgi:hypothetical protein